MGASACTWTVHACTFGVNSAPEFRFRMDRFGGRLPAVRCAPWRATWQFYGPGAALKWGLNFALNWGYNLHTARVDVKILDTSRRKNLRGRTKMGLNRLITPFAWTKMGLYAWTKMGLYARTKMGLNALSDKSVKFR